MDSTDTAQFIVGIGASAGGITAMRTLIEDLPVEPGLAYVLVQHLDPKHISTLDEILERVGSKLAIQVVEQDMPLRGACLFIVPPRAECTLRDGVFHIEEGESHPGPLHTIDTLLTSMAESSGDRTAAVILSGTGSDGLQGVRAVKGAGGMALVQDPEDAEYPGMPQAVIRERLADVVAPLAGLGEALQRVLHWAPTETPAEETATERDTFAELVRLLVRKTGLAFDQYKETSLRRRIERRMMITGEPDLDHYRKLVEGSDYEADRLKHDLLISVTSFFRDPDTFAAARNALQQVIARKTLSQPIRVWVAGCATGEEAFSIAILLADLLGDELNSRRVQIFATDVDEDAIAVARRGVYLRTSLTNVPKQLVNRFFDAVDGAYQVKKVIRDLVTFAIQDLLQDPPFNRLDMVSCRNVLIYFNRDIQDRLLRTFHYVLNAGGYLVLGPSENVSRAAELFEAQSGRAGVFATTDRESPLPAAAAHVRPVRAGPSATAAGAAGTEQLIRDVLFDQYIPPSMLVDAGFNVLYVHGDVSAYARLPQGSITTNLLEMIDLPLRVELRLVVQRSQRENTRVQTGPLPCLDTAGLGRQAVTLIAIPVVGPAHHHGPQTLVVFEGRPAPSSIVDVGDHKEVADDASFRITELEQELAATRDHLQAHVEELEAANEELQSINEEYQSTTEELQSANEELQTTNEEVQSTNEELATVNQELSVRSEELSSTNRDLEDILNTAVSGIVVLDENLQVTRYSSASRQIFDLLPTSIGRPLIAVGGAVDLALLSSQIQQALHRGAPLEHELELGDKVFLVHFIPRDTGNAGLIISFVDITGELTSAREAQQLAAVLRDARDAITVYAPDGSLLAWNRGAERLYGYTESEALAMSTYDLAASEQRDEMRRLTERLMSGEAVAMLEAQRLRKNGRTVVVSFTAAALENDRGEPYAIATTERDVTLERTAQAQRRHARLAHEERLTTAGEMAAGLAHELNQPLTAIMHFCDLASSITRASRVQRREELLESLDGISQQAQRAGGIIRNLRRFVGRLESPREPHDLNDVIRETVSFMHWDLEHSDLTVELDLAERLEPLTMDRSQVQQVLVNLIRNSTDAMVEAASPKRLITISTTPVSRDDFSGAMVTVRDTGPGVPQKVAALLFNPFQTTKANGLGMGLWISRSIVEAHGGRLWPDVDDGTGATFHFTLRRTAGLPHD